MRQRKNKRGMTLRDYQVRFTGWKIPQGAIIGAYNSSLSYEEARDTFLKWHPKALPNRTRALGLTLAQKMLRRALRHELLKLQARRLMPDAAIWVKASLEKFGEEA